MKVKIGDIWISADEQPISVQFEDWELEEIKLMTRETSPNLRFTIGDMEHGELLAWVKA